MKQGEKQPALLITIIL